MALLDFLNRGDKDDEPKIAPVLPKDIYAAGTLELADTIAPAAMKVGSREIELGEKVSRTFYTISYPRFLTDSWFTPIVNLDKVLDVSIFIHPMETAQALRNFQKKVAEVQSQIADREAKGLVRDPMLDTAYQDLETLRDNLQQAQERLFDIGLYLTLYASSKEELDKVEGDVRGILDSKLVYTKPALFEQEQGFRSTLPIASDEQSVKLTYAIGRERKRTNTGTI